MSIQSAARRAHSQSSSARAVGTGPRAILAADALVGVDQHDAVFGALVGRARRAHGHAGGVLAVQAGFREMHVRAHRVLADLEGLHPVEERTGRLGAVGIGSASGPPIAPVFHSLQLRRRRGSRRRRRGRSPARAASAERSSAAVPVIAAADSCRSRARRARARHAGRRFGHPRMRLGSARRLPLCSMRTRRSNQAAWPVTGSAVGPAHAVARRRQQLVDQVVQQEAVAGFGRVRREAPGALRLPIAFQVHTVLGLTASLQRDLR